MNDCMKMEVKTETQLKGYIIDQSNDGIHFLMTAFWNLQATLYIFFQIKTLQMEITITGLK